MSCSHADVLGVFAGDDPGFVVCGVCSTSDYIYMQASVGGYADRPLWLNVGLIKTNRTGPGGSFGAAYGTAAASLLASPVAWEVISIGGVRYLYINGNYEGTTDTRGAGDWDPTTFTCFVGTTQKHTLGSLTVYADCTALGDHADIHNAIWPALRVEALAFEVT